MEDAVVWDYFTGAQNVPTQEESKQQIGPSANQPKIVDEVPSDWKDKNWSPQRFTQVLTEIFDAKNYPIYGMDKVNLVSANIHYSEFPTLLNEAKNEGLDSSVGMFHLGGFLERVAESRQEEAKKYTDLIGEAERHALWREIGETKSPENRRHLKMNASPAVIYGMVLMLTKLCKRVKGLPDAATEAIEVLTQWISPETIGRWGISLPQCKNCTVKDVTDFCEKIKFWIRRDHLLALVETVHEGAGFGVAEDRAFDVAGAVDEFLKKVPYDDIDRLLFTPKADKYEGYPAENIYRALKLLAVPPPDERLPCNFSDQLDEHARPIKCDHNTRCHWSWTSYIPGGPRRCGCYTGKEWRECVPSKCDHSKCNH